jgi:hypothetical protein
MYSRTHTGTHVPIPAVVSTYRHAVFFFSPDHANSTIKFSKRNCGNTVDVQLCNCVPSYDDSLPPPWYGGPGGTLSPDPAFGETGSQTLRNGDAVDEYLYKLIPRPKTAEDAARGRRMVRVARFFLFVFCLFFTFQ